MNRSWILAATVGALATSACKRNERTTDLEDTRSGGAVPSEAQAREKQGDDAVLGVLAALNQREIDQATAALPKVTASDARAFAQHMVAEHTQAAEQASQLAAALGVVPRDNAVSAELKASSQTVLESLASASASAGYDRMYLQSQVEGHRSALNLIDTMLTPDAGDQRVRALLDEVRRTVQEHLRTAQGTLQALPTM